MMNTYFLLNRSDGQGSNAPRLDPANNKKLSSPTKTSVSDARCLSSFRLLVMTRKASPGEISQRDEGESTSPAIRKPVGVQKIKKRENNNIV